MIRAQGHSPLLPHPVHTPCPLAPLAAPQQMLPMGNTSQDHHPASGHAWTGHTPISVSLCAHPALPSHHLSHPLGAPAWV